MNTRRAVAPDPNSGTRPQRAEPHTICCLLAGPAVAQGIVAQMGGDCLQAPVGTTRARSRLCRDAPFFIHQCSNSQPKLCPVQPEISVLACQKNVSDFLTDDDVRLRFQSGHETCSRHATSSAWPHVLPSIKPCHSWPRQAISGGLRGGSMISPSCTPSSGPLPPHPMIWRRPSRERRMPLASRRWSQPKAPGLQMDRHGAWSWANA